MTESFIKEWLHNHSIWNYHIKEINGELVCNVNTDIDFTYSILNESEFPFKFGHITGDFLLPHKPLKSFKNFPDLVDGDLDITEISIRSLDDLNTIVKGDLICEDEWKEQVDYKQWMIQHLLRKNS